MRTPEEINRQIEGLLEDRKRLPEYIMFGTPNHACIDAQIAILKGEYELDDMEQGNWEEHDEQNQVFRSAEDAQMWLEEERDDDLFDEQ